MSDLLRALDNASEFYMEQPKHALLHERAAARIRELEAIVEKLPMDRNGDRIAPGDRVRVKSRSDGREFVAEVGKIGDSRGWDFCALDREGIITREAAEKARQA